MNPTEHLLAIVEPSDDGETTLDLAHAVVERGGTATVMVVVTDRTLREFRAFARAEDLSDEDAEGMALDRLRDSYTARVGGAGTDTVIRFANAGLLLSQTVAEFVDATTVAVPHSLADTRPMRRFISSSTIPVIIAPALAA